MTESKGRRATSLVKSIVDVIMDGGSSYWSQDTVEDGRELVEDVDLLGLFVAALYRRTEAIKMRWTRPSSGSPVRPRWGTSCHDHSIRTAFDCVESLPVVARPAQPILAVSHP